MAVGPIPWNAIDQYARRYRYDEDQVEYDAFVYLIRELDGVFMEYSAQKTKPKGKRLGKP